MWNSTHKVIDIKFFTLKFIKFYSLNQTFSNQPPIEELSADSDMVKDKIPQNFIHKSKKMCVECKKNKKEIQWQKHKI